MSCGNIKTILEANQWYAGPGPWIESNADQYVSLGLEFLVDEVMSCSTANFARLFIDAMPPGDFCPSDIYPLITEVLTQSPDPKIAKHGWEIYTNPESAHDQVRESSDSANAAWQWSVKLLYL